MSKINSGTILLAFLAILFGLGGVYMVRQNMKRPVVAAAPAPVVKQVKAPSKITIPMSSRSLPAGHKIALDDIALVKLTREQVKEYGLTGAFMTNPKQIIGKKLNRLMPRGKTFDTANFYPEGTGPGIAERIKPGRRAITVSFTATNALMGFAGPGQSVDVLFHYGAHDDSAAHNIAQRIQNSDKRYEQRDRNPSQSNSGYVSQTRIQNQQQFANGGGADLQSATVTLVQNAEILAFGDKTVPTRNSHGVSLEERVTVTLLASPTDVKMLRVAAGHGELSLSLRGPNDNELVKATPPIRLDNIIPPQPKPKQMEIKIAQMKIYRGDDSSVVQFDPRNSISHRIIDSPNANVPEQDPKYQRSADIPWRDLKQTETLEWNVNNSNEPNTSSQLERSDVSRVEAGERNSMIPPPPSQSADDLDIELFPEEPSYVEYSDSILSQPEGQFQPVKSVLDGGAKQ